ncbi:hypothetical protein CDD82_4553 [Ophiocordyceps australis]|uniref:Uncharacterized protein n=1 Tax=Ophiocordyceps australis TaxID=1399860 RepID=A0A2C5Z706_9HYPO|nr:hypothetical protein CDD82_4553 [Ophiocordyceps australis]
MPGPEVQALERTAPEAPTRKPLAHETAVSRQLLRAQALKLIMSRLLKSQLLKLHPLIPLIKASLTLSLLGNSLGPTLKLIMSRLLKSQPLKLHPLIPLIKASLTLSLLGNSLGPLGQSHPRLLLQ